MQTTDLAQFSRFDLRRRLGSGGFGEVFEAWDRQQDSVVALKRLTRLNPVSVRRFKQEFRSLAGISHPNLAQLYELVSDGEEWSFTMELVRGLDFVSAIRGDATPSADDPTASSSEEPLHRSVSESPVYDELRLRGALRQLIRAVRALHAAGKLHRDLKPHNVLVTAEGRVVVLDFGMVLELRGEGKPSSSFVGTPHYMAPEQAGNGPNTTASDWYSVGVMLYEVLVGAYPVVGRTVVQLLLRKQMADAPDDSAFPASTPDDLRAACQALLARDPEDRPGPEALLEILGATELSAAPSVTRRDGDLDGPFGPVQLLDAALYKRGMPHPFDVVGRMFGR